MPLSATVTATHGQAGVVSAASSKSGLLGGHGADDLTGAGHQSGHFAWTEAETHGSGMDDGAAYTGPVSYLQHEYIWSGPNGRAENLPPEG